jgi:hypothetical protein
LAAYACTTLAQIKPVLATRKGLGKLLERKRIAFFMNETSETATDGLLPNYAELIRLLKMEKLERFVELVRIYNPDDVSEETQKNNQGRQQYAGKLLCAARTMWETLKAEGRNRRQDFPDYFASLTGCRPSSHGSSCAKTYRNLVLTGKIAESDYDENSSNAIEFTSRIISKVEDDINHPAVTAAALILQQRGRTTIQELKMLFDRLAKDSATGQMKLLDEAQAANSNAIPISYSPALELAFKIAKEGHHSVLAAPLNELAASTSKLEEARSLAVAATKILASLSSNRDETGQRRYSDEVIASWKTPEASISIVTDESLKADYVAAKKKVQEIEKKLNEAGIAPVQPTVGPNVAVPGITLKRWRGAEQRVLELLRSWGWQVEDVSLQKLGYDIEGCSPEGEEVFVEVKSIENSRQAFILTSNEEAVAREKGNAYRLALVRLTNTHLEVAFISDPVHQLKFTRQYRQLVWECVDYEFDAKRYPLE